MVSFIKKKIKQHGKRFLIFWLLWSVFKWTMLILLGKELMNYL